MQRLSTVLKLTAAAVALAATAEASAKLYAFGDSLSDNGNLSTVTFGLVPGSDYFEGRFSNGPVWVERLGFDLGSNPGLLFLDPFFPSFADGYDFAHGGASARNRWYLPDFLEVQGQADKFASLSRSRTLRVGAGDLGTVWAGANDYLLYGETSASNTVGGVMNTIATIDAAGLDRIVVFNLPLLGDTPGYINTGRRTELNAYARAHNSLLRTRVQSYDAANPSQLVFIDAELAFSTIMAMPQLFGFSVVRPGQNGSATGNCLGDGLVLSACPTGYLFYDTVHPTAKGHDLIARVVTGVLAQPAMTRLQTSLRSTAAAALSAGQYSVVGGRLGVLQAEAAGFASWAAEPLGFSTGTLSAAGQSVTVYGFGAQSLDGTTQLGLSAEERQPGERSFAGAGADMRWGQGLVTGAAFAWTAGDGEAAGLITAQDEGFAMQAYGAYVDETSLISLRMNAQTQIETLSRPSLLSELPSVSAETESRHWSAMVTASTFWDLGFVSMGPEMMLLYAREEHLGYRESGTFGLVDAVVEGTREDTVSLTLGLQTRTQFALDNGMSVAVQSSASYLRGLEGDLPAMSLRAAHALTAAGQASALDGAEDAVKLGLRMRLSGAEQWHLALDADHTVAKAGQETSLALKAGWQF